MPKPVLVKLFVNRIIAAGAVDQIEVSLADHLFYQASTGANGDLVFSFDQQQNAPLLIGQVVGTENTFSQVVVQNKSNASITYTIVVSVGVIDFKGLVVANNVNVQQVQTATGIYGNDIVGTAAAVKCFTGVGNLAVIFCADPGKANPGYIGFDYGTASGKKVFALTPGAIYTFNSFKGDLWQNFSVGDKLSVSYM